MRQKSQKRRGRKRSDTPRALPNIIYLIGSIAIVVQLAIGYRYIDTWGQTAITLGLFCLIGLMSHDIIKSGFRNPFKLEEKKFESMTLFYGILCASIIVLVQGITQYITLTVAEDVYKGIAIIMTAVCEEFFFRGVVLLIFMRIEELAFDEIESESVRVTPIGMLGIVISALWFALTHQNYYDDPTAMISVFISGIALGFVYYLTKDLGANILGHFIINFIFVWQWLVIL